MKVVIVGGVAGGATAGARIRRLDERAEIVIFERSGYISYANCGLPYYIGGVIADREDLTLQTPEGFFSRYNISARVNCEVIDINRESKTVSVVNLVTGEKFEENYDKLILSPGAKPVLPDFYINDKRVFILRTVEDTLKIRSFISSSSAKSAVVIGGGFIGMETAENLKEAGLKVTLIQRGEHLLNTVDKEIASFIHATFRSNGIRLLLNAQTEKIVPKQDGVCVELACGEKILCDMVLVAVGVVPENALAKKAGLKLGVKGAIKVNERMQTSAPDIYAVGDAVEVKNFVTGQESLIALAGPANKQGRIAGDNICGIKSKYKGSQGSSVIKIFDKTVAVTGINEEQAKVLGYTYEKVILSPSSHAGYYPGGKVMTLKLLYEKKSLKILGAQIYGSDGADKRIDVLATAIRAGLKADELKDLDLAYAPPYSSAKDPVNMAGFIAENIENGIVKQFYYEDIPALTNKDGITLLDARTAGEYVRGHAEGFINIPLDSLRERLSELDIKKDIYVICQSGLRSYIASRILAQNGFNVYNFAGGYRLYSAIKNEELTSEECFPCGKNK